MATIGELLAGFPLAMPPGKVPAAENPANPRQVAAVMLPASQPGAPTPPTPQPFDAGQGTTGYIPPAAHPTLGGKIGALFGDPDFNRSLMVFGANLMRTPEAGQNYGDTFANALLSGMNTFQGFKQQKKQEQEKKAGQAEAAVQRADDAALRRDQLQLGRDELQQRRDDSAVRADEARLDRISRENIAKIQAQARTTGAGGGTGGGTSAVEFAFGEAKKAYLAMGLSDDEAQVRAVKDVIVSQKAPSETAQGLSRYNQAVDIALQSWMRNPETLMQDPQGAAAAIHNLALGIARQSATAGQEFAVAPAGVPALTPPAPATPTPSTEPAPIPPPARSGGRGGPGQGTRAAPFNEQEAQAAADALRRPIKVWVINPATGVGEEVTVTPGAR